MSTVKYKKANGREIEVNDNEHTRHYATVNGWIKTETEDKPKRGRPRKTQLDKPV